jgi:hypothetical protein
MHDGKVTKDIAKSLLALRERIHAAASAWPTSATSVRSLPLGNSGLSEVMAAETDSVHRSRNRAWPFCPSPDFAYISSPRLIWIKPTSCPALFSGFKEKEEPELPLLVSANSGGGLASAAHSVSWAFGCGEVWPSAPPRYDAEREPARTALVTGP